LRMHEKLGGTSGDTHDCYSRGKVKGDLIEAESCDGETVTGRVSSNHVIPYLG
jgi:hypothetical protein